MAALSQRHHCKHPINESEDVGALRRAVARLAENQYGSRAGEAELVATELGTNLLKHAEPGGYVLYRQTADGIEFLSVDTGPGMTSRRAPGGEASAYRPAQRGLSAGLATIRRISANYDCYSGSKGTVALARLGGSPGTGRFRGSGVNIPLGGNGPSGDAWAFTDDRSLAALVVDGLGHGDEAAIAARAAADLFDQRPFTDPAQFLSSAHQAMRGSRGGVAGACVIDPRVSQLTFAGIGNIAGVIVSGNDRQHLLSHPGTLGTQLASPRIHARQYRWPTGATLVMGSDGIRSGWNLSDYPGLLSHDPAVIAATLHRDFTRSTDDATVLVVRDMQ